MNRHERDQRLSRQSFPSFSFIKDLGFCDDDFISLPDDP